jgi:DNA invertase Pin-like site-specific DNA recombinase
MCKNMEKECRIWGYARVSTDDQDLTLQRRALIGYGVEPEHIKEEHASGGTMNRPEWNKIMRFMREGDTVVVWKLDRLGRTLTGVLETLEEMKGKGVNLVSITDAWDTSTPFGDAMFKIAIIFAELERKLISERTKAGIAAKRLESGKHWGRKGQIDSSPKRLAMMQELIESGEIDTITARQLVPLLNAADRKAETIKNPETVRRWIRMRKDEVKEPKDG